jgi:hypothetical protein
MKTLTEETPFNEAESGRLSVVGAVPPELAQQLRSIPSPKYPDLARLPKPGERDPITGCSRSWLIDADASLPTKERFLFRVRRIGKLRGAVFINVAKLLAFLRRAEEADTSLEADSGRPLSEAQQEHVPA